MPQKFKKILTSLLLLLQIGAGIGFTLSYAKIALADDPPAAPVPADAAPAPSDTSSGSHASDTFPVIYLKAEGQNSSYLKSSSPIASFIVIVINFLAKTIGSLAFLSLIIGGFVLLTSHGNETMLTKGKDIIKYAIIGLVIALSAYFITAFVQSLFYELPK